MISWFYLFILLGIIFYILQSLSNRDYFKNNGVRGRILSWSRVGNNKYTVSVSSEYNYLNGIPLNKKLTLKEINKIKNKELYINIKLNSNNDEVAEIIKPI